MQKDCYLFSLPLHWHWMSAKLKAKMTFIYCVSCELCDTLNFPEGLNKVYIITTIIIIMLFNFILKSCNFQQRLHVARWFCGWRRGRADVSGQSGARGAARDWQVEEQTVR